MTSSSNLSIAKRLTAATSMVVALLVVVAVAPAASPVKGGLYAGTINQGGTEISFQVSKNGKKATGFSIPSLPFFCEGGSGPSTITIRSATITKKGTFNTTGKGKANGKVFANVVLTGKFLAGNQEQGKLKVTYTKAKDCSGSTTYSTATA